MQVATILSMETVELSEMATVRIHVEASQRRTAKRRMRRMLDIVSQLGCRTNAIIPQSVALISLPGIAKEDSISNHSASPKVIFDRSSRVSGRKEIGETQIQFYNSLF